MIPIALMIPARVWSTFYNISISSWWWWSRTKTSPASRPGISALIISLCVPIFLLFIVLMKCKSDSCFYPAGQGGLATKTQSCLLVLVMVLVLTATLFICLLAHSYPQAWALPLHLGRHRGHHWQIKKFNWGNLSQNKLVVGQWAAWPPVLPTVDRRAWYQNGRRTIFLCQAPRHKFNEQWL